MDLDATQTQLDEMQVRLDRFSQNLDNFKQGVKDFGKRINRAYQRFNIERDTALVNDDTPIQENISAVNTANEFDTEQVQQPDNLEMTQNANSNVQKQNDQLSDADAMDIINSLNIPEVNELNAADTQNNGVQNKQAVQDNAQVNPEPVQSTKVASTQSSQPTKALDDKQAQDLAKSISVDDIINSIDNDQALTL